MVSVRIGKNIELYWDIKFKDSETHLSLEDSPFVFEMIVKGQRITVTDYEIIDGRLHWFFLGKDQGEIGIYDLRIVVNPGEDDQIVYDKEEAFRLVRHSWEVEEGEDDDLEYIVIELESEIGKIIDGRYIIGAIAQNARDITALQERIVLISDAEYAILVEEGLVDPTKIYMVYEQEEEEEGT